MLPATLAAGDHEPCAGLRPCADGTYYFERNPLAATYPGTDRLRAVLRAATVPVMWLAGHVHWNTWTTMDGIPHFTMQSLTESFTTNPEPAGAWALLELDSRIALTVFGRDGFAASLDAAATLRRWVPPLPVFGALADHGRSRGVRHGV